MAYYSKGYQTAANNAGATDTASVKKIQEQLNAAGASITVDGIWGKNTQAAYNQYGSNLSGGSSASSGSTTTATTPSTSNNYIDQLQTLITQMQTSGNFTPSEYKNPYADQLLQLTAPKTDEEYRQQAQNQYMPQYNAQVEALKQAAEKEQLGYQQQLQQLATAMQDSRESTNATYAKNISDLNNNMLRRGMARSSYAAQTEANARTGWANALSKVERDYQSNVNYVGQQQQLATSQLAQSVARLESDLATQIANYEQTLRGNDKAAQMQAYQQLSSAYDSWAQQQEQLKAAAQQQQTSNLATLLQFLADYQQNENQFNQQMQLNRDQFNWQKSQAKSSGSSGGSGGNNSNNTTSKKTTTTSNTNWSNFNTKVASAYSPAKVTSNSDPNLYSAAAQYALEQIRRRNGEVI